VGRTTYGPIPITAPKWANAVAQSTSRPELAARRWIQVLAEVSGLDVPSSGPNFDVLGQIAAASRR